jgi:hypothetical protein
MKKISFIIITLCISNIVFAQLQRFFNPAPRGAVFFTNSTSALYNSALISVPPLPGGFQEGYSQIYDTLGSAPLLSTNGIKVYNKSSTDITGTPNLMGNVSSTNSAIAVRLNSSKAIIITTQECTSTTNTASYTLVDISSIGLPTVSSTRNVPLNGGGISRFGEKILIAERAGTQDYWLILHELVPGGLSDKYVVFEINAGSATINYKATYAAGSSLPVSGNVGQIKAFGKAPETKGLIATANFANITTTTGGSVDVLDFDFATGAITTKEIIDLDGTGNVPYGLEFSQNGTYIYFTSYNIMRTISRLNTFTTGGSTIQSSLITLSCTASSGRFGQMQRMLDGNIYFPSQYSNKLNVLTNTNSPTGLSSFATTGATLTILGGASVSFFSLGIANYPYIR